MVLLYSFFLWFINYQDDINDNSHYYNKDNNIKIKNLQKIKKNNIYLENQKIWKQIKSEIKNFDSDTKKFLLKFQNNVNIDFLTIKTNIIKIINKNISDLEKTYLFLNSIDLLKIKDITLKFKKNLKELSLGIATKENLDNIISIAENLDNIYQNIFLKQILKTKKNAHKMIKTIEKKLKKYQNEINLEEHKKANLLIQNLKTLLINSNNISQINLKMDAIWIFEQEILISLEETKEAKKTAFIILKNSQKYLKLFEDTINNNNKNLIQNKIKELENILKQKKISALMIDQKTLQLTNIVEKIIKNNNINKIQDQFILTTKINKINNKIKKNNMNKNNLMANKVINSNFIKNHEIKIYILTNIILCLIIIYKHF